MSKSLYTSFLTKRILRPLNREIKRRGLSPVLKSIIDRKSRDFIINLSKDTEEVLKNDRVLLICNHPSQVDVLLLLAALPHRSKTFLIIMHNLVSVLPAVNKHLIPVYIGHRIDSETPHNWKQKLFEKIHFSPEYSPDVAHKKNIKSISLATRKIDEGSLVAMFPAGGSKNGRDFLPGVGHIVKDLKFPKKTKIVMAYVSGTSTWDFFRLIPFLDRFLPRFRIDFSQAFPSTSFSGDSGRKISQSLQRVYDNWSLPFEPLPKFQKAALYLRSFFLFLLFRG